MLPDTGERYLSTPLFDGIEAEMNEAEKVISASTPTCRFDAPAAAPAAPAAAPAVASQAARDHIDAILSDGNRQVVLFGLEWCEFTWAVHNLFRRVGIDYHTVDLDGADYRDPSWAADVRLALAARCGAPTIPQLFICGRHVGGATETFDACNDGAFAAMMAAVGQSIDTGDIANAYDFLPKWLHPRGKAAAPATPSRAA